MAMLAGKTVLITGGASGIGRAWAEAFLRDSSPPTVICCDIDEAGLAEVGAQGALTLRTDVTDAAQVKRMIEFAVSETGRLDVLYNNAGVGFHTRVERVSDGEFEQHVAIHLFATVNAMRHSIPIMRAQGSGRIINTCSRNAEGVAIGASAYAAAKAGIWALTRTAAIEAASRHSDQLLDPGSNEHWNLGRGPATAPAPRGDCANGAAARNAPHWLPYLWEDLLGRKRVHPL